MEYLNHLAYAIGALSFLLRDVLYLRCVAVVSNTGMVVVEVCEGNYTSAKLIWNAVFVAINMARIATELLGERRARFSEEETELYETLFRNFTKLEFLKLLRAARWAVAETGRVLTRQGEPVAEVMLISNGVARVEVSGRAVAELRDGQLVGEMSFVTGNPATATVTVTEPTKYLTWSKEKLRSLLHRNPSMRLAMSHVLSTHITEKLAKSIAQP